MGFVPKMVQINNPIIEFSEDDARHLYHPHDDAFIINIQVGDYNTHRVLLTMKDLLTSFTTWYSSK